LSLHVSVSVAKENKKMVNVAKQYQEAVYGL
jgi:hypothetical protein